MALTAPTVEMIGRDAELDVLRTALDRASAGQSGALLVAGEAGIGKSRLLREFGARVGDAATVLVGWCLDYGSTPAPYGPLPAILRGVLAELGDEAETAAGPGREALRLLLPERGDGPVDRSAVGPEGLGEVIANLLEAAAERRPLVIVVEDLHWADAATLSMLSFLLRALMGRRVLFLFTCRIDEVRRGGPVRGFLVEAERARLLDRVALRRLDPVAVRQMVQEISGPVDEAALARLLERSEGVPFFVEELACNALGPIPDTLRDVLLVRFDLLGDDAKRVVRTVSGSDGAVPHRLLSALAGLPDDRLDEAVREAANSAILAVLDGEAYGFRHALLREAVHDDLLPGERARLHRAYAEALEGTAPASALAFHWHQAHDPHRALVSAVDAMQQAKTSYAFSTAARFGELALELWEQVPAAEAAVGIDRVTLLARLGSILRNAGDGERALTVVDLALAEADPVTTDPAAYVRLLRDKALYLQNLGRPGSVELLREGLAVMDGRVDDDRLRATMLNYLAGRHLTGGRSEEAVATADEAFRLAERIGDDAAMSVAANLRGSSRVHLGQVAEGLADYRLSWECAVDHDPRLRYRVNYSDALRTLGRYREAVRVAEEGIAHARRLGIERTTGSIMTQNMVEPLLELGEIDRVEELLAKDLTMRTLRIFRVYTTVSRIRALAWRGRIDEARSLRDEWHATFEAAGAVERQIWYSVRAADLSVTLAAGDLAGARELLRALEADPGPRLGHEARMLLDGGWVVASLRARGDDAAAAETAAVVRRAWDALPAELRRAEWRAMLAAMLDPSPSGVREAVRIADGEDMPAVFRVLLRRELVRLLVTSGARADRAVAAEEVSIAAEIAERIGHAGLRREIAAIADATGLAGPLAGRADGETRSAGPDPSALTAREQQVLELIAEGLSNRQIGERLFISAKTASVHVSAILRKLGVATRTEAAVAASRRG
ncbi:MULTISPECIES: helix-turn-helix transcriptional regulator [Bacteria]|uniref:helix-turn-helix transcriptional regulator n=1 Tax=Bacteria TaxID=2 RepID=UPI003C79AA7C